MIVRLDRKDVAVLTTLVRTVLRPLFGGRYGATFVGGAVRAFDKQRDPRIAMRPGDVGVT